MSTTGKKAMKATKADEVTSPEETKVNNAKAQAKPKSKSPKPDKRGPVESAPE